MNFTQKCELYLISVLWVWRGAMLLPKRCVCGTAPRARALKSMNNFLNSVYGN